MELDLDVLTPGYNARQLQQLKVYIAHLFVSRVTLYLSFLPAEWQRPGAAGADLTSGARSWPFSDLCANARLGFILSHYRSYDKEHGLTARVSALKKPKTARPAMCHVVPMSSTSVLRMVCWMQELQACTRGCSGWLRWLGRWRAGA